MQCEIKINLNPRKIVKTKTINVPDTLSIQDCRFLESMAHARNKYPGPHGRYMAFASEFGEALHAVQKIVTGRGTVRELGDELRQAAQMALRFAIEGDPSEFSAEVQREFPSVVQPDTELRPHHNGYGAQ